MQTVKTSWTMIEEVLRENANSVFRSLRKPASVKQIQRLQDQLPRRLPNDFVQSLAIHDGLGSSRHKQAVLFNNWVLLPVAEIIRSRNDEQYVQSLYNFPGGPATKKRAIKNDLRWRDGWVPILGADGDGVLIDLDPGPGGKVGQVVEFYRIADTPMRVLALSYREWLANLAHRLKARQFSLNEYGDIQFDDWWD